MSARPAIEKLVARFNDRAMRDAELNKELQCISRNVQVDLGTEKYYFTLANCKVDTLHDGVMPGKADVTLISDPDTIQKVINGEMRAMKALALKKVRVKGSIDDLLRFRRFL